MLTGVTGEQISLTGYSSASNYALTVRNQGTGGKAFRALNSSGVELLNITNDGLGLAVARIGDRTTAVARILDVYDADFPMTGGPLAGSRDTLRAQIGDFTSTEETDFFTSAVPIVAAVAGLIDIPNGANFTATNGHAAGVKAMVRAGADSRHAVGLHGIAYRTAAGGTSQTVTVAAPGASGGATSVPVSALAAAISSGTTLIFTNGKLATLTANASLGATSLTVSALNSALSTGNTAQSILTNGTSGIWARNTITADGWTPSGVPTGYSQNQGFGVISMIGDENDVVAFSDDTVFWGYDLISLAGTAQGVEFPSAVSGDKVLYNSIAYNARGVSNYNPVDATPRTPRIWAAFKATSEGYVYSLLSEPLDQGIVSPSTPIALSANIQASPGVQTIGLIRVLASGRMAFNSGAVVSGTQGFEFQSNVGDVKSAGTAMAVIDTTGLGIGVTSPTKKVDIYEAGSGLKMVSLLTSDSAAAGAGVGLGFQGISTAAGDTRATKAAIAFERMGVQGIGDLHFLVNILTDTSSVTDFANYSAGRFKFDQAFIVGSRATDGNGAGTITAQNGIYAGGLLRASMTTATTAGGALSLRLGASGPNIYVGSGAPTISAVQGSLYLRTDGGGTTDRMFVNTTGSTTWTAVTTVA